MSDSRIKNSKRNLLKELLYKIVSLLLPFSTRTVIIYVLGVLYLGLNSLYGSILTILSLAELGFGAAMVFSMYEPIAKKDDLEVCALLNLYRKIYRILGGAILCIGLIFMFFLPYIIKDEVPQDVNVYVLYLIFLTNTCLSYFLFAYKESLLIATQRSDIRSNVHTIFSLVTNVCQLVALWFTRNYYAYCLLIPIFTIAQNLTINYITSKRYPQFKCKGVIVAEKIVDIKKRVGGLFIYKICYVFRDTIDSVVISAFLGLAVLGKFNNYFYIVTTITGFLTIIKTSMSASVGNSMVLETEKKNHHDFQKFQLLYMAISSWATVCLFCLIQPFITLWAGKDYLFHSITLILFCALFYCYKMGDICAVYRQAAGLWWQDKHRPIVEAIVNLSLNLCLVKVFGVNGVIVSTIFCLVFINSIWASYTLYKYYFKSFNQWLYIKRIFFYGSVTILITAITGAVCYLISDDTILGFVYRGLVCMVLPIPLIIISFHILPEFKDAVEFLCKLLGKRNKLNIA